MEKSDLLVFVWLMLALGFMIAVGNLVPGKAGQAIGGIGYFAIMFGGMFGQEVAFREITNKYMYIRAYVRPNNKPLHIFVKEIESQNIWRTGYATRIRLAFPIKIHDMTNPSMNYGKVESIVIYHDKDWNDRLRFRPGKAVYLGIPIPHPSTEMIELYPMKKGAVSMDRADVEPVFYLHSASMDYYEGQNAVELATPDPTKVLVDIAALNELKAELVEAKRSQANWHQQAIAYEERISQMEAEEKALLETKGNVKDLAHQLAFTIFQHTASIEEAVKMLGGRTWASMWTKYVMYTIIAGLVIAYLWANPDTARQIAASLGTPAGLLVVVLSIIGIYMLVSKRRTPT